MGGAQQTEFARPFPATHAVTLSRPLCAYLLAARYTGHGSTDDARNFVCARQD
jgi:hypothetical protein